MFYGLSCQGQASLVSNQGELSCGGGERLSRPTQTTGRGLAALGPSTTPATGTVLHNARPALELGRYDARAGGDVGLMINGSLPQLHAGYVYGGSRIAHDGGGADCSDFVSRVLRASSVVQSPSTLTVGDFENIYHHLRDEPALPLTVQQQRYAHCFVPINLNVSGNAPLPGDLVGMRRSFQGIISDARARGALEAAHIVMVRDFDASTGSISTIEAAGGEVGGLTTELSRPLYDPECPGSGAPLNTRSPRPDIFVLRPQEDCFRAAAR